MTKAINAKTWTFTGSPRATYESGNLDGGGGGGAFTDGQPFVITGSGFGSKATPQPLVYDSFEAGTLNGNIDGQPPEIETIGSWTWDTYSNSGSFPPKYSNTIVRANSTRSALIHYESGTFASALKIPFNRPNTGDEVFVSFRMYYDLLTSSTSNFKNLIMYGNGSPSSNMEWYVSTGGDADSSWRIHNANDGATTGSDLTIGTSYRGTEDKWILCENYIKQSSNGGSDGEVRTDFYFPSGSIVSREGTNRMTRRTNEVLDSIEIGAFHSSNGATSAADIYFDNIYIDGTRQRVVITDSATWAGSTKWENQVATAWSDSSITITAKQGEFSVGNTIYIYIIGSDGSPISTNGISATVA